jgi:hypothetical protein
MVEGAFVSSKTVSQGVNHTSSEAASAQTARGSSAA